MKTINDDMIVYNLHSHLIHVTKTYSNSKTLTSLTVLTVGSPTPPPKCVQSIQNALCPTLELDKHVSIGVVLPCNTDKSVRDHLSNM